MGNCYNCNWEYISSGRTVITCPNCKSKMIASYPVLICNKCQYMFPQDSLLEPKPYELHSWSYVRFGIR